MIDLDTLDRHARVLIAGSEAEAARYAAARIEAIDAEMAAIEDRLASVRDTLAVAIDKEMTAQRRIDDIRRDASRVQIDLRENRAAIREIEAQMAEARALLDDAEARFADHDGRPEVFAKRIAQYEDGIAAAYARIEEIEQTIADARGLDTYIQPAVYEAELAELRENIDLWTNIALPDYRAGYQEHVDGLARAIADRDAARRTLADLDAALAARREINARLLDENAEVYRHVNEADRDLQRAETEIEWARAQVTANEDALALLSDERADLATVLA